MKRTLILALATATIALAQPETREINIAVSHRVEGTRDPVQGAPYSATIVNESVQTLADGNRIVQRSTGTTARDSEGRTRQDMALPQIGNMSAANQPHVVFINDPVAHVSYTLNLTDKTAHRMPGPPPPPPGGPDAKAVLDTAAADGPSIRMSVGTPGAVVTAAVGGALFPPKLLADKEQAEARTENLGTETVQGVSAEGIRTTRTIAAGEIGNDRAIEIVTEVWTSPELKTVVSSKRSDPRMGDQTFQLTNIVRAEPDPSLFTVPADFKLLVLDAPGPESKGNAIFYRPNE